MPTGEPLLADFATNSPGLNSIGFKTEKCLSLMQGGGSWCPHCPHKCFLAAALRRTARLRGTRRREFVEWW